MSKISDYQILQYLGSGTFGTCCKVCLRAETTKIFAWKEIDYSQFTEPELQMLCQEVNLLRNLQHANVVRFHGRIIDTDSGRVFVLMDYCSNGDLSSLIACLAGVNRLLPLRLAPEAFVRRVCVQLLSALDYCHLRNIIHRDLKPANVLLDAQWDAKLADFGLSRVLSSVQSLATTFVGTPMYMSPELLGDQEDGFSTPKSDVWALGCVLHELMALKAPFSARSKPELRNQIRNGCHTELPVAFSPSLRRLAAEMLRIQLAQRPTAAQLLARPEVRFWASAAKPWSEEASHDGGDCEARGGGALSGAGGRSDTGRQRAELHLLQNRLADKEAELSKLEEELSERERLVTEADERNKMLEARLQAWEANLLELNQSLLEKQQLIAAASAAAAGRAGAERRSTTSGAAGTQEARPHRHTNTAAAQQRLPQQQRLQHRRDRVTLQSTDLSPIVSHEQQQQQQRPQPQLLNRGAAEIKEAKNIANGKYSPATLQEQQQQEKKKKKKLMGTYEPILGVVTRRQKQLQQQCSPVCRLGKDSNNNHF